MTSAASSAASAFAAAASAARRRAASVSPRTVARVVVAVVLALIGIGTVGALGAYRLSSMAPEWWRTVDAGAPGTIELAERAEQAVSAAVHKRRALGEPWTVAVSVREANAWLNVMLPRWLENQGTALPGWAEEAQVHFDRGWVAAGVRVRDDEGTTRYASIRASLEVDGSGALWVRPEGASLGRLRAPLGWAFGVLERRAGEEQAELVAALAGEAPAAREAALELGDGRVVRLRGVHLRSGKLLLTCVTER